MAKKITKKVVCLPPQKRDEDIVQKVRDKQKCGRYLIIGVNVENGKVNCRRDMINFPLTDLPIAKKLILDEFDKMLK